MAAINKSVAKKIIASFLLAAMTFSLLPKIIGNDSILAAPVENNQETTETANTAVTKKSKPLTTHEPQTYIFDYNQNIGSRLTTESGKSLVGSGTCPEWDWLPILLPGDKVKIIPKLPSEEEAIKNNGVSVGEGGLVLKNMTAKSIEPSFKVTKAVAYGSVDEIDKDKHDNRFIQEFEITGTEPVAIVVHGGTSGYTNLKKSVWINNTEVKITLSYGADWLEFQRFPEYINLNYQLFDGDNTGEEKKLMDDKFEVTYYGETENPDAIWAVDAINNLYAKDEEKTERFLQRLEKKLKVVPVAGNTLAMVPTLISLVRNYIKKEYTEAPIGTIIAVVSALIYLLSPADAIPDFIPGVGYVDDALVIAACLKLVDSDVKEYQ